MSSVSSAQTYEIPGTGNSKNLTVYGDTMIFVTNPFDEIVTSYHLYTYKLYNTSVVGGDVKIVYTPMYSYVWDDTVIVKSYVYSGAEKNITVDTTFESHVVTGQDEKTVVSDLDFDFVVIDGDGNVMVIYRPSFKQYDTPVNKIR